MSDGAPVIPELLSELEGRWRAFTTSEDSTRARYLLGDAWRKISRTPGLLERMAADVALAADVRMVACNATKRAMVAEGRLGVTEEERTDGPISRRRRYSEDVSAEIEFTEDERKILEGDPTAASAEAAAPRWTGDHLPHVIVRVPGWRPW